MCGRPIRWLDYNDPEYATCSAAHSEDMAAEMHTLARRALVERYLAWIESSGTAEVEVLSNTFSLAFYKARYNSLCWLQNAVRNATLFSHPAAL